MVKETTNYLTVFIAVVLALSFIVAIAALTTQTTERTKVDNEIISIATAQVSYNATATGINSSKNLGPVTNYPTGWKIDDCPLEDIVVTNSSGTVLTLTTDYTLTTSSGILTIVNNTNTINAFKISNNSLVDYSYCGAGYLNLGWGRTILNTNVGLYAIAILVIVVVLVYVLLNRKDND